MSASPLPFACLSPSSHGAWPSLHFSFASPLSPSYSAYEGNGLLPPSSPSSSNASALLLDSFSSDAMPEAVTSLRHHSSGRFPPAAPVLPPPSRVSPSPSQSKSFEPRQARHRRVDAKRRLKEASALARLEALVAGPARSSEGGDGQRPLRFDRVALLEAVALQLALAQRSGGGSDDDSRGSAPPPAVLPPPSTPSADSVLACRKVACTFCHASKQSCNGGRPCSRCVKAQRGAQCVDRPFKRLRSEGPTVVDSEEEEEPKATLPFPPPVQWLDSVIPLPRPFSLEAERLSLASLLPRPSAQSELARCLYSVHLAWFRARNTPDGQRWPVCLREKVLYWAALSSCLSAEEMTELIFASISIQGHRSVDHRTPRSFTEESHSAPHDRTGCRVCQRFCGFLRRLWRQVACNISWTASPLAAIADWVEAPNHALLTLRCLVTEEQLRADVLRIDAVGKQGHKRMFARKGKAGGPIAPSGGVDGSEWSHRSWTSEPLNCQWFFFFHCCPPLLHAAAVEPEAAEADAELHPFALSVAASPGGESLRVRMAAQVNAAFERLLGLTQAEVRQRFIADGERAYFQLLSADSWEALMTADHTARVERRGDYQLCVRCVHLWRAETPCLLHCKLTFHARGTLLERKVTLIPLAL